MNRSATKLRFAVSWLLLLMLQLTACGSRSDAPIGQSLVPLPDGAVNFSQPGDIAYQIEAGTVRSPSGCMLSYDTYHPAQLSSNAMVLLAHGLYRNKSAMRGWAAHWVSYGVPVTIVSFCSASLFDPRVERNAADMQFLANTLHQGPVLYAGYSAGGLAAWLAAGADSNTLGYLGLDSVDSNELATSQLSVINHPALLLLAEPTFCNAYNNMVTDLSDISSDQFPSTVFRIKGSTHCNFSHPFGRPCSRICGTVSPVSAEPVILESIRVLATAWIVEQTTDNAQARAMLSAARRGDSAWAQRVEVLD